MVWYTLDPRLDLLLRKLIPRCGPLLNSFTTALRSSFLCRISLEPEPRWLDGVEVWGVATPKHILDIGYAVEMALIEVVV